MLGRWDQQRIYCGSMVKDGQRIMRGLCDIMRSRSGIKRADIARLVALSVYGGVRTPGTTCQCIYEHFLIIFALHFARCDHVFAFPDLSWSFQRCVIFLFYRAFSISFLMPSFIYLYAKRGLRRHRWVKLSVDETAGRRKFDTSSVERRRSKRRVPWSLCCVPPKPAMQRSS